ncbi:hypothetical protein AAG747_25315 [Rapidithrix thailandica]|uniref:Lipoprotein n=1 Tax=Rapidithrix thailandica TaxID=413964 RepID=A0AAW9S268_9BACT
MKFFCILKYCLLGISLGLISCSSKIRSEQELMDYVMDESHGLYHKKSIKDLEVEMYYKPTDLLVTQELRGGHAISLDSLRQQYGKYAYFIFNASRNGQEPLQGMVGEFDRFSEVLQTLAFRMEQHVFLTTSQNDTIPLADSIFPRFYGASRNTTLMLVFGKEDWPGSDWVQVNWKDPGLRTGNMQFRFDTETLQAAPQIEFPNKK